MMIAVVGAGVSGLACAEALRARGVRVRLFDKSRGVGGRMALRRASTPLGEAAFDHGAQYFTAREPEFVAKVKSWIEAGVAAPWPLLGPDAFVGVPAMNAPAKFMAEPLDVRLGVKVESLQRVDGGWRLGSACLHTYRCVVIALPAEQAAVLAADAAPELAARAKAVPSDPCWTVMAAFDQPLADSRDVLRPGGIIGWAARNRAKPGRSGPESWVVQASPDWSREHLHDPEAEVSAALLAELQAVLGCPPPRLRHSAAHRWRYARSGAVGVPFLLDPAAGVGCCGDWLLGPRVEAAWTSGDALGRRLSMDLAGEEGAADDGSS